LVVHVHSTEFDRSGEHVNQQVYDIERAGMQGVDRILCVSHFTRRTVVDRYGVSPDKAEVAHNGVDPPSAQEPDFTPIKRREKLVVFSGRITLQKGPEYFLRATKRVLEKIQDVRFVIAGNGDLFGSVVELAAACVATSTLRKHACKLRKHSTRTNSATRNHFAGATTRKPTSNAPCHGQ
jgi:glycogen(starch) synthase